MTANPVVVHCNLVFLKLSFQTFRSNVWKSDFLTDGMRHRYILDVLDNRSIDPIVGKSRLNHIVHESVESIMFQSDAPVMLCSENLLILFSLISVCFSRNHVDFEGKVIFPLTNEFKLFSFVE